MSAATVSNEQGEEETLVVQDLYIPYNDSIYPDHNSFEVVYEDESSKSSSEKPTPTSSPPTPTPKTTSAAKKLKLSRSESQQSESSIELLREFINRKQPEPINLLPTPKPKDNLSRFFDSIADTMRTFSPLAIANIKMKVSQLVGEEEIAMASQNQY